MDHIKHMLFPTKDKSIIETAGRGNQHENDNFAIGNKFDYLKGPQSKDGGIVTIV